MNANGIITGYLTALLWVEDSDLDIHSLDPQTSLEIGFVIGAWTHEHRALLDESGLGPEQIGHDLYLTSNRHGAGFWDRGLGELGDRLTEAAHGFPYVHPFFEETSWGMDINYQP